MAQKTYLRRLTFLFVAVTVLFCVITYGYERRVVSLQKQIKQTRLLTKKAAEQQELIKKTLLERTDALMACNNEYDRTKKACANFGRTCHRHLVLCDDIIRNKRNCRRLFQLRRSRE